MAGVLEPEQLLNLEVFSLSGTSVASAELPATNHILDLKQIVAETTHIPVSHQLLLFDQAILGSDTQTLESAGLCCDAVLQLLCKSCGESDLLAELMSYVPIAKRWSWEPKAEAKVVNGILLRYLVRHADLNLTVVGKHRQECSALHLAAELGFVDVCSSLLFSDNFALADAKDANGFSALHIAAERGHCDVVSLFLESHKLTDVNAKDPKGRTALHIAVQHGHIQVCQLLLKHERFTEVNAVDGHGSTALHAATEAVNQLLNPDRSRTARCVRSKTDAWRDDVRVARGVCRILLEHCDLVDAHNNLGLTAFQIAVRSSCTEVCSEFLQSKRLFDVSASDPGTTVLHVAAEAGNFELCRLMLQDVRCTDFIHKSDNDGRSAADCAADSDAHRVCHLLKKAGVRQRQKTECRGQRWLSRRDCVKRGGRGCQRTCPKGLKE